MRVILEFQMPEEHDDYIESFNGPKYAEVLKKLYLELENAHEDLSIVWAQEAFRKLLNEKGITIRQPPAQE